MPGEVRPIPASLGTGTGDPQPANIIRTLHNINKQAATNMPGNMTVEGPNSGIILGPLQDDVAGTAVHVGRGQDLDVADLGVVDVCDAPVPEAGARGEDEEVVAVQVHGVGEEVDVVVDHQAHGAVAAEVVDVPLRVVGVAGVAGGGEEEDGVVVVCTEGLAVNVPDLMGGGC